MYDKKKTTKIYKTVPMLAGSSGAKRSKGHF
jgi:hypothetical protein